MSRSSRESIQLAGISRERILSSSFYIRPTLDVAHDLLGKIFCHSTALGLLAGRIVEVECYHQENDEASHSFRGRTRRNAVMFDEGGRLYVYFTYGMHHCMNVVTEGQGVGAAVLIRGIEPVDGVEIMKQNRATTRLGDLTNGPAKICEAFGIAGEHNGLPLTGPEVFLVDAPAADRKNIVQTPRIGISRSRDLEWRFALKDNAFVSRKHIPVG